MHRHQQITDQVVKIQHLSIILSMPFLDSPVTLPASGEMVLIDDFLQEELAADPDLYQMLMAEPAINKKASIAYDYTPAALLAPEPDFLPIKSISQERSSFSQNSTARRCTCTKTRCQKNYCQCFKLGVTCSEECGCIDCCNRIPLFIPNSKENQSTKCKCMKSHCSKNYCECRNAGKKCGEECKCIQCQNCQDLDDEFLSGQPRKKLKLLEQSQCKTVQNMKENFQMEERIPRSVMKSASF